MAPDDLALVKAANEGDRQALDQLLRRHYDRIYAVCRRVTGSDADAADAAQEAMISIVRGLSKFDGRSAFSTWAYRIATNASLDELRRRRRRPVLAMSGDDDEHTDIGERSADPVSSQRIDAIGDRMALDVALREVPDVFRVPLVLRDVGDLDYGEIAEILDTPVGTVKSRIARGRAALSELLRSGNQTDPDTRRNTDL